MAAKCNSPRKERDIRRKVGIRQEEQRKGKTYDQYWVVFDKDDFPDEDFNLAIQEAKAEGFQVAWSNHLL